MSRLEMVARLFWDGDDVDNVIHHGANEAENKKTDDGDEDPDKRQG